MEYTEPVVDTELDELVADLPAIALEGPKGVGKTVTAQRRASTIFALDDADELELLVADPRRLDARRPPVLVDEWQRDRCRPRSAPRLLSKRGQHETS